MLRHDCTKQDGENSCSSLFNNQEKLNFTGKSIIICVVYFNQQKSINLIEISKKKGEIPGF